MHTIIRYSSTLLTKYVCYQLCQLYCTTRTYCDFVVWLREDFLIERIYLDEDFMTGCTAKSEHFLRLQSCPN